MKKGLILGLALLFSMGLFAQSSSFSIMPGYQFSSGEAEDGFVVGADYVYYFTDGIGLHIGYTYNEGNFEYDGYIPYFGHYTFEFDNDFNIIEVGPEFVGDLGSGGQIYGQLNAGMTFGGSDFHVYIPYYGNYHADWDNEWTLGAALGYRYFFNDSVGIALQGTYHYIDNWEADNFWDARVGITFKF